MTTSNSDENADTGQVRIGGSASGRVIHINNGVVNVGEVLRGVQDSGGTALLAGVLVAWIRQRKAKLKMKITRKDGTAVEIEVDHAKDEHVRQAADALSRVLTDDVAAIEVATDDDAM